MRRLRPPLRHRSYTAQINITFGTLQRTRQQQSCVSASVPFQIRTMASGNGRLMKELAEVSKEDSSGVIAKPVREGDLRHLRGSINGPLETVYEGGVFDIDIIIPKQYPFEPPKMMFITKIWHPNISSQTGAICLVSIT